MQLIFGKDNAEKLRERYVVLDLETVEKDGVSIEVYCLINRTARYATDRQLDKITSRNDGWISHSTIQICS